MTIFAVEKFIVLYIDLHRPVWHVDTKTNTGRLAWYYIMQYTEAC